MDTSTTGTAGRPGAGGAGPAPRRGAALAVLCAGMFLVLLDVTIVNVALPGIGRALRTGLPGLQGVVDGYAVAIAGLLPAGGALGDRIGRCRMTLAGFALFGAASPACGAAPGAGPLIAARTVQGAGAALLLPMAVPAPVNGRLTARFGPRSPPPGRCRCWPPGRAAGTGRCCRRWRPSGSATA